MIRTIAVSLVCLSLAACGPQTHPGSAQAKAWCAEYNAAIEAVFIRCYGAPKDAADAEFGVSNGAECANDARAVAAGRETFDGKAAAACLSALKALACPDIDTFNGPSNPCNRTLTGTVADGKTCYGDPDCGRGSYCEGVGPGNCPATCAILAERGGDCSRGQACDYGLICDGQSCQPAAAKGQPCGGPTQAVCDAGLYCKAVSNVAGVCTAKGAAGASCTDPVECQTGLTCLSGKCAPIRTKGQSCTQDTDCGFYLYCASGSCTEAPRVGGTCGSLGGGHYADCLASWCRRAHPSDATGTCTAFLEPGATCDPNAPGACGTGECVGGTCAAACAEK